MRGVFWPGAKRWRATREAPDLLNAKRSRHAEMHDEQLRAVEIGDEIFGAAPEPLDTAVGEALSETLRKRKPQIRPPQSMAANRSPTMAGSSPRRTVSTSGSSGTFGILLLAMPIAAQLPFRSNEIQETHSRIAGVGAQRHEMNVCCNAR